MGLRAPYLNFIESAIDQAFEDSKGLRMLELGDQVINDKSIPEKTGKAYFENRGFEHVSVDSSGRLGSVARDLRDREQFKDWVNAWHVITNSGTTEHVEPFATQYDCFRILHDCVTVGGVVVHLNPDADDLDTNGTWKGHCRFYYTEAFHDTVARECGYELLANTVIRGLRCAAIKKVNDEPFMTDRAKFLQHIAQREMNPHDIGLFRMLKRKIRGNL